MNKIHSNPSVTSFSIVSDPSALPPVEMQRIIPSGRLIVLVSETEMDISLLAHKVWELANSVGCHVQFLGLCRDAVQEPSLRRRLITLSAMVQDGYLFTDIKVEHGKNWLDIVRSNWQPGDVLACIAEQRTGWMHQPLTQILEAKLGASVVVLSGLHENQSRSKWFSTSIVWIGSISLIIGFFWLQSKIIQMPKDWAHTLLLYLSLFIEIGLISGWNSLFPS